MKYIIKIQINNLHARGRKESQPRVHHDGARVPGPGGPGPNYWRERWHRGELHRMLGLAPPRALRRPLTALQWHRFF